MERESACDALPAKRGRAAALASNHGTLFGRACRRLLPSKPHRVDLVIYPREDSLDAAGVCGYRATFYCPRCRTRHVQDDW